MDCRQPNPSNTQKILSILSTCQNTVQQYQPTMSFYCHMLYAFLCTKLGKACGCTLQELTTALISEKEFSPDSIVLTELLTSLSEKGLIVYVKNQKHLQSSWIIAKPAILLKEVIGKLFAPDHFTVHRQPIFSNTGIILFKTLCDTFPKLNVEMIVQLLQSMEICQQVHSSILQDSNLTALPSSSPDELVFFPGQIKERRPEHVFSPKFGWYLECSDPHQFFTTYFLHVLLLRLAFTFPLASKDHSPSSTLCIHQFQRRCQVWRNGISWNSVSGVSTIVEIDNHNRWISVLLSEKSEVSAVICSSVIKMILDVQQELCSTVSINECLISPTLLSVYPFDKLELSNTDGLFDISDVARSMLFHHKVILDRKQGEKIFLTKDALSCEPYYLLQPSSVCQLFDQSKANQPVTKTLREDVCKYYPQMTTQNHKDLRESINKCSIFVGRNCKD